MIVATVVDVDALWQTIWHAAVSAVFVTVVFSLAVLGTTRAGDLRRAGHHGQGVVYGALGVVGLLGTLGGIVYGIVLISTK
jgi:hypothetical protein